MQFTSVKFRAVLFPLVTLARRMMNCLKYRRVDMFHSVAIEISTECNRRCAYCPNSTASACTIQAQMEADLFHDILVQLRAISYAGTVWLNFYNEPLMSPNFRKCVQSISDMLPGSRICIATNGDFLTDALLNDHENMNIRYFVTNHGALAADKMALVEKYSRICQFTELAKQHLTSKAGLIKGIPKIKKCGSASRMMQILFNGDVCICCEDYLRTTIYGNVRQGLVNIWYKPVFVKARKSARKGSPAEKICQRCLAAGCGGQ